MKIIFKAGVGASFPFDRAQEIGEELLRISTDEELPTASEIVESAKDKTSPLHDLFEWDDSIASEKWREHQARLIVNHLIIIKKMDHEDVEVKAFWNVSKADDPEDESARRYVFAVKLLKNDDYRRQMLKQALDEIKTWREKYRILKELHEIFEAAKRIQKKLAF